MTNLAILPPAPASAPVTPPEHYMVRGIPATMVFRFWPFAAPFVKRALDRTAGEYTANDMYSFLLDGLAQLWLVYDGKRVVGAAITEIANYPKQRRLRILAIAGANLPRWNATIDETLSQWALTKQCTAIEAYVRRGLVVGLRPLGYRHRMSIAVKTLSGATSTKE